MHPLSKVKIQWSPELAYAVGLLTTDGSLSKDGRHIDLSSKDRQQLENFLLCLKLNIKIGAKYSGSGTVQLRVQFGDVGFYKFLISLGLMPNKTKVLGKLTIPREYFFDFLRGHLDGDGCFYSYFDPRWKSSYMFYTTLVSASKAHIVWLQDSIRQYLNICGYIITAGKTPMYQLRYAKAESLKLLPKLYYNDRVVCLSRKRRKIETALKVIGKRL